MPGPRPRPNRRNSGSVAGFSRRRGAHRQFESSSLAANPYIIAPQNMAGASTIVQYRLDTLMFDESNRLKTFTDGRWSNPSVIVEEMARWGFFYTGDRDTVRCAFCSGTLSDWRSCDDPHADHLCEFPLCPFMLGCEAERITRHSNGFFEPAPRHSSGQHAQQDAAAGPSPDIVADAFPVMPDYSYEHVAQHVARSDSAPNISGGASRLPEAENEMNERTAAVRFERSAVPPRRPNAILNQMAQSTIAANGAGLKVKIDVNYCHQPTKRATAIDKHLKTLNIYTSAPCVDSKTVLQLRVNTFRTADWRHSQRSEEMARAGFYFTGENDRTRCFYCGIALFSWNNEDNPWLAHETYSPQCDFLAIVKNMSTSAPLSDHTRSSSPQSVQNLADDRETETPGPETDNPGGALETREQIEVKGTVEELDEKKPCWRGESIVRFAFDCGYAEDMVAKALITNDYEMFSDELDLLDRIAALQLFEPSPVQPKPPAVEPSPTQAEPTVPKAKPVSTRKTRRSIDSRLCSLCMDAPVSVVLLPCCHLISCPMCVMALSKCPICRTEVQARLRIFAT